MIVKQSTPIYALIDELGYYDDLYCASGSRPRVDFYDIDSPFLMDSQANKLARIADGGEEGRVRKRKNSSLGSEVPNFLVEICTLVSQAHRQYLQDNRLAPATPNWTDNNRRAKEAVKMAPSYFALSSSVVSAERLHQQLEEGKQYSISEPILFHNPNESVLTITENNERCVKYLIPEQAEFVSADVQLAVERLIDERRKFNLIVMDPPWPNRSVKRKKTYECFQISHLWKLRIDELLAGDGLVCIWLTNSESVHSAAKEILQRRWGLTLIAKWHWLKICKTGETVFEFKPWHKVPFESILFACRSEAFERYQPLALKNDYCLIGVPNANPSRKPPICPILQELEIVDRAVRGCTLELYGRYLLPNTTSVGYEVLKFQHNYFFLSAGGTNAEEQ